MHTSLLRDVVQRFNESSVVQDLLNKLKSELQLPEDQTLFADLIIRKVPTKRKPRYREQALHESDWEDLIRSYQWSSVELTVLENFKVGQSHNELWISNTRVMERLTLDPDLAELGILATITDSIKRKLRHKFILSKNSRKEGGWGIFLRS